MSNTITFEIFFSDLTPDCQQRLMECVGVEKPEDMNWDAPWSITILEFAQIKENK